MALGYHTASGRRISDILEQYGEAAAKRLGTALYREGRGILAQSQALVPVDTGALRASGYVTPPSREGNEIVVAIGYGGTATQREAPIRGTFKVSDSGKTGGRQLHETAGDPAKYAIYVHEDLQAFHKVGMAKYLEIPFNAALRGMVGRIADFMRKGFAPDEATGDGEGF